MSKNGVIGRGERLGMYIAKSIHQYAVLVEDPSYVKTIKKF